MSKRSVSQKIISHEIRKKKKYIKNKIVLGSFLIFALVILGLKIISGILLDLGLVRDELHIGFWSNPEKAFQKEFTEWSTNNTGNFWTFLNDPQNIDIKSIIQYHPSTIWFTTQFTWLTTLIVIVFLVFKFFQFEDLVPRWLKWIMTQRTLSLVTMYELLLGVTYWIAVARHSSISFLDSLWILEFVVSLSVHALIPIGLSVYTLIYLIHDRRASMLRESFAVIGLIFPAIYSCYYLVLTIVWNDPYPVTRMHEKLTIGLDGQILDKANWDAWASELWKWPISLIVVYVLLGFMTIFHNLILFKWNKYYNSARDYETIQRKKRKLNSIRRKLIRQEAKKRAWNFK